MPDTDIITASQKIEDKKEQERLIKLVKENITSGNGAIIRTSAVKKDKELIKDIELLQNKWKEIQERYNKKISQNSSDSLVYESENIVDKMIIDLVSEKIENIVTNNKAEYDKTYLDDLSLILSFGLIPQFQ